MEWISVVLRIILRLWGGINGRLNASHAPAAVALAVVQLYRIFPPAGLGDAQETDALPAVAVLWLFLDDLQNVYPLGAAVRGETQA